MENWDISGAGRLTEGEIHLVLGVEYRDFVRRLKQKVKYGEALGWKLWGGWGNLAL